MMVGDVVGAGGGALLSSACSSPRSSRDGRGGVEDGVLEQIQRGVLDFGEVEWAIADLLSSAVPL